MRQQKSCLTHCHESTTVMEKASRENYWSSLFCKSGKGEPCNLETTITFVFLQYPTRSTIEQECCYRRPSMFCIVPQVWELPFNYSSSLRFEHKLDQTVEVVDGFIRNHGIQSFDASFASSLQPRVCRWSKPIVERNNSQIWDVGEMMSTCQ